MPNYAVQSAYHLLFSEKLSSPFSSVCLPSSFFREAVQSFLFSLLTIFFFLRNCQYPVFSVQSAYRLLLSGKLSNPLLVCLPSSSFLRSFPVTSVQSVYHHLLSEKLSSPFCSVCLPSLCVCLVYKYLLHNAYTLSVFRSRPVLGRLRLQEFCTRSRLRLLIEENIFFF